MQVRTWQLPRFTLVEINLRDDLELDPSACNFPIKIVSDQLFICWVKPKSRWQAHWCHLSVQLIELQLSISQRRKLKGFSSLFFLFFGVNFGGEKEENSETEI